jgi:uncharacterized protein (DUF427 family)
MAGTERPAQIDPPGPGQESVWDYPRPPRIEPSPKHVIVLFNNAVVAESRHALRVLETSSPPVYYLPPGDVRLGRFVVPAEGGRATFCEWKGTASYLDLRVGDRLARDAAWSYLTPSEGYEAIKEHVAFYPGRVDACYLDGELVRPQPGSYYGGWVTDGIVGPFKGDPGTEGW